MSFYPHVNPGDRVVPSAQLENDLRDLVNRSGHTGARPLRGCAGNTLCVQVWNCDDVTIPANGAVSVLVGSESFSVYDGVLPCKLFRGDYRLLGIVQSEIPPNATGSCVVRGIVEVPITGWAIPGNRVLPVIPDDGEIGDDYEQEYGVVPAGGALVLGVSDDGKAVIELGSVDDYAGYFKVALAHMGGQEGEYGEESYSSSESSSSSSSSSSGSSSGSSDSSSTSSSSESSSESEKSSESGGSSRSASISASGSESGSGGGSGSTSASNSTSDENSESISEDGSSGGGGGGGSDDESGSSSSSFPEGSQTVTLGHFGFSTDGSGSYNDGAGELLGAGGEATVVIVVFEGKILSVKLTNKRFFVDATGPDTTSRNVSMTGWQQSNLKLRINIQCSDEKSGVDDENGEWDWNYSGSGSRVIDLAPQYNGENAWGDLGSSSSSSGSESWSDDSDMPPDSENPDSEPQSDSEPMPDSESDESSRSEDESSSSEESSGSSGKSSESSESESSSSEGSSSESSGSESSSSESDESSSESNDFENENLVLAVFDGAEPTSGHCGFADSGEDRTYYPRTIFTNWKQEQTMFVYISNDTIRLSETYPEPHNGVFKRLLARLVYCDGAYSVVQEQHGPIIENYHLYEEKD